MTEVETAESNTNSPSVRRFGIRYSRYTIAAIQLWGGTFGVVAALSGLWRQLPFNHPTHEHLAKTCILFVIVVALYGLAIVGGLLLLRNVLLGWQLSQLCWLIQIVRFAIFKVAYAFSIGGSLLIYLQGDQVGATYHIGNVAKLSWGLKDSTVVIGVNLVAIVLLSALRELECYSSPMDMAPFLQPV